MVVIVIIRPEPKTLGSDPSSQSLDNSRLGDRGLWARWGCRPKLRLPLLDTTAACSRHFSHGDQN